MDPLQTHPANFLGVLGISTSPQVSKVFALALGAGLAPGAAQALDTFDAQLEVGSSVSVAATVEALMLGIVLGTVPITVPWASMRDFRMVFLQW